MLKGTLLAATAAALPALPSVAATSTGEADAMLAGIGAAETALGQTTAGEQLSKV